MMNLQNLKCDVTAQQAARLNKAVSEMEVNPLKYAIDGHTHIGVVRCDGYMVKYLGWMIDDVFQFDPSTRRVIRYL